MSGDGAGRESGSGTTAMQPSAAAMLHLLCNVPSELEPLLSEWWERFHHRELLTLDGFLSARRAQPVTPGAGVGILVLYGLSEPSAADQPRPADFKQMPAALDGKVTFNRRILRRVSEPATHDRVGPAVLQLLRASPVASPAVLREISEHVTRWPQVVGATAWRSAGDPSPAGRSEVVHLADTDVLLAELGEDQHGAYQPLLARAAHELPGWDASVYRQVFPSTGVLLPTPPACAE